MQADRAQKERLRLRRQTKKGEASAAESPMVGEDSSRKRGRSMAGAMMVGGEEGAGGGHSEAETSVEDITDYGEEWEVGGDTMTSTGPNHHAACAM